MVRREDAKAREWHVGAESSAGKSMRGHERQRWGPRWPIVSLGHRVERKRACRSGQGARKGQNRQGKW